MLGRRHDVVVEALGALASYAQIPCRVGARVQCLISRHALLKTVLIEASQLFFTLGWPASSRY